MPAKKQAAPTGPTQPTPPTFRTLADAAAHNEREGLRALRRRLADAIEDDQTPPYALANLSRQLAAIMHRLSDMGEGREHEPESALDQARAIRAARLAKIGRDYPQAAGDGQPASKVRSGPKPRRTAPPPRL